MTPDTSFSKEQIDATHSRMVDAMDLPAWAYAHKCSECGANFTFTSVRAISLKTNPQHIGDIAVELQCKACSACYELHIRKFCAHVRDFINALDYPILLDVDFIPNHKIPRTESNLLSAILANLDAQKDKIDQAGHADSAAE